MAPKLQPISNWGNYPRVETPVVPYRSGTKLPREWIPRGLGRCYGDSSLGKQMLDNSKLNRFLDFDAKSGLLTCESGITFEDILKVFLPKGWFVPVTPGTKYVSMGGAVASDVHGKNHHVDGSIGQYLQWLDLLIPDGRVLRCSRLENPDIFDATIGGMGLTGMILRIQIQLIPVETSLIRRETIRARNLDEILDLFQESENTRYTVAWLDTLARGKSLGRSVLQKGEHMSGEEFQEKYTSQYPLSIPSRKRLNVPFFFPSGLLNPLTIGLFNQLYFHKPVAAQDYPYLDSFFYPLDIIHNWNRIYGKKGFTQYQFVVPGKTGTEAIPKILAHLQANRMGAFLAVLKLLGPGQGLMSFPMEGYTLALDFPIQKNTFSVLDELDRMVLDYGGRVYLTKDVRLNPEVFRRMYPNLEGFQSILKKIDPEGCIRSLQSERLGIHSSL